MGEMQRLGIARSMTNDQLRAHIAEALGGGIGPRAAVIVEGISDQVALQTLAIRIGRDLAAERVVVVPIGGATNIGHALDLLGPSGLDVRLAGLCDAAEEGYFARGLERAGLGSELARNDLEALGFYVCEEDLEHELIRAIGPGQVENVVDGENELRTLRTFQAQPAWRGRPLEDQLRRWLAANSGRKVRYVRLFVEAVELARMPRPLRHVLDHV